MEPLGRTAVELIATLEQLVGDIAGANVVPRCLEHARLLLACVSGSRDISELGLTRNRLEAMIEQRFPLAFPSEDDFLAFHAELATILHANGISGSIRIIGTSTSLFSLNPQKPADHYFDDDAVGSSDLDVGIESPNLASLMLRHGTTPSASALSPGGSFKEPELRAHIRGLGAFLDRWSDRLHRVFHIGAPGDGEPLRSSSPTDFCLPIATLQALSATPTTP